VTSYVYCESALGIVCRYKLTFMDVLSSTGVQAVQRKQSG